MNRDKMAASNSDPKPDLTSNYLFLFSGQLVSQLGSSIVQFALIWYITAVTNSGLALSIASLLGFGSFFITTLFAGVLADRYDRKWIMLISDLVQALAAILLMYLFYIGTAGLLHLYALLFVRGLMGGIQQPASQAVRPSMVPREKLSRINSFTSFAGSILNLGTPVIAAFLLNYYGLENLAPILAIDVVTFIFGVVTLIFVTIPKHHIKVRQEKKDQAFKDEFLEGLRVIRKGPGMIALLISFAMTNFLLSGSMTFLPLIVNSPLALSGNEFILALGFSAVQAGNILVTIILMKKKITNGLVKKVTIGILGGFAGLALAGVGVLLKTNPFFIMGLLVLGLSIPVASIASSLIWQTYYPDELQGRVWTVRSTFATMMTPLSYVSIGLLTEVEPISLRYLLLILGTLGIVMYSLVYRFTSIRHIDKILEEPIQGEGEAPETGANLSSDNLDHEGINKLEEGKAVEAQDAEKSLETHSLKS